jgi:hexosaminidase
MKRLEGRTVLTLAPALATDDQATPLIIHTQGAGKDIPGVGEDESYRIDITRRQAILSAPTVVGAIRGLETVLQLLDADRNGYFLPAVQIDDRPRFPWRGLLIDVRVESKKFPKLHQLGSDGNYYTQEQVKEIIAYARDRGIRVVPEFDIPGHSTSWLVGHPELGSAPGPYTIERRPGIFEPALDPTREEVYKFLETFLGEMAALFPDDYLHIGGDENEGKQWDRNPAIQAYMKQKGIKDNHALQAYFNTRLLKILQKHKKKMIGWDEILQPEIPKDVVIHSWRGTAALAEAARKGYDGILSNGYYIDLIQPASQHYVSDPLPADSTLTPEEAKHVLGGEATMWAEWVTPETIDSRIWPRTAAIAERLWSPRTVTDVPDMYRRLAIISLQLEELGLTHRR